MGDFFLLCDCLQQETQAGFLAEVTYIASSLGCQSCWALLGACACFDVQTQIHLLHQSSYPGKIKHNDHNQNKKTVTVIYRQMLYRGIVTGVLCCYKVYRLTVTFLSSLKGFPNVCSLFGWSASSSLKGEGMFLRYS